VSNELKACPFCGNEFMITGDDEIGYRIDHRFDDCPIASDAAESGVVWFNKDTMVRSYNGRFFEDTLDGQAFRILIEFQTSFAELAKWNSKLADTADDLRAKNAEYAKYISDDQLKAKAIERAEKKDAALWVKAMIALQEQKKVQSLIADLEAENKALRLIANSHSMSEMRRMKIMTNYKPAPDKEVKE
jgi:hypothetical protein